MGKPFYLCHHNLIKDTVLLISITMITIHKGETLGLGLPGISLFWECKEKIHILKEETAFIYHSKKKKKNTTFIGVLAVKLFQRPLQFAPKRNISAVATFCFGKDGIKINKNSYFLKVKKNYSYFVIVKNSCH